MHAARASKCKFFLQCRNRINPRVQMHILSFLRFVFCIHFAIMLLRFEYGIATWEGGGVSDTRVGYDDGYSDAFLSSEP